MPRRKLTADDELEITNRNAAGQSPQEIADAIGVTRKVVVAWLDAN
jgi:DNA-binding CsgD family transcriptional regulator